MRQALTAFLVIIAMFTVGSSRRPRSGQPNLERQYTENGPALP